MFNVLGIVYLFIAAVTASANDRTSTPGPSSIFLWARLQTKTDPYWNRHAEYDDSLVAFIASHAFPGARVQLGNVPASQLEAMCEYPFIYSQSISALEENELTQVAEYLRRGGFLFIDLCRNIQVNPDPDKVLETHVARLRTEFPELTLRTVETSHPAYSLFFVLKDRPIPSAGTHGRAYPLYAFELQGRTIAIMAMNGFQCTWSGYAKIDGRKSALATAAVQTATNIYLYALTR
ncbi:MAG TPA: DUF4159 domain-containing protein [Opitutaceae bacterium]|nr:DUF4159 domain-containing protein [Opitutaceae bacterium]